MKAIEEKYLRTDEVAAKIRRSAADVSRMCKRGQLRAVQIGRTWLIPESALEELLTPKPVAAAPAVVKEVEPVRFVTASQKRRHTRKAS